jgi:aspartyl-tRNA(Asn)/glutamyl-tRNA(Gln) amidotransferase subunit A
MIGAATGATQAALARIARLDPLLHAFVHVASEHALEQARHLDAMVALGVPAGPLAGMVVGIKDIIDVAGLPTGGGSLSRAEAPPAARDAIVAQRLRAAGAVLVGKTHTVEYAFGGWGTNVSLGTPRNPYDLATPRAPGGSSSGSGVAVAAGLVPAALGSDTGGSVRLPASFCGSVGLKTTAGLLPLDGVLPLAPRFDTVGPLARTVADAARVFAALLAEDFPRVAGGAAFVADPAGVSACGVRGLRVGVLEAQDVPLHADTARVFADTQRLLKALGAALVPTRLPRQVTEYMAAIGDMIAAVGYATYGDLAETEPCRLGAPVRRRILSGREILAHRLIAEYQRQTADLAAMPDLFGGIDALLTPSTAWPAPKLADIDEAISPALFTRFVNYLDLAAISLPMGLSGEGLPVGMQVVVPGFHEVRALTIAAALEAVRGGPLLLELP